MDWHDNPEVAKRYQAAEALTGPFALDLIKQCSLDQADGSKKRIVLDNACGTGVVTLNLYAALSPAARENLKLISGDVSPSMVKSVQGRIEQNGWKGATSRSSMRRFVSIVIFASRVSDRIRRIRPPTLLLLCGRAEDGPAREQLHARPHIFWPRRLSQNPRRSRRGLPRPPARRDRRNHDLEGG